MSAPSHEPPTIRFVDAGGVRLRTSVRGSGRLLLITGLGASLDLAQPFERELTARGVQVVSFDADSSSRRPDPESAACRATRLCYGPWQLHAATTSPTTTAALLVVSTAARRAADGLLHGSLARFIERPSVLGYFGQLYAIAGWTSMPWLWRLHQPTLVLAGDDDPIGPLINGRILAHCIPEARLHTVSRGGHMFLLERPAEIARLVTDFLEVLT